MDFVPLPPVVKAVRSREAWEIRQARAEARRTPDQRAARQVEYDARQVAKRANREAQRAAFVEEVAARDRAHARMDRTPEQIAADEAEWRAKSDRRHAEWV